MSNLYNWQDERMNELKMREINREIEHLHLLKEAGISGPGFLSRMAKVLRNWREAQIQRRQGHNSTEVPAYKAADDKAR